MNLKSLFLLIITTITLYSCGATNPIKSTDTPLATQDADKILDATIIVNIPQDNIQAEIIGKHTPPLTGLIGESIYNKAHKAMINTIKPLADRVNRYNFRIDFIEELRKKVLFTQPEKIILTNRFLETKDDIKVLLDSADTSNVIILETDYKLDINYRSFTVNTLLSVWDKNKHSPLHESHLIYNSDIVTFDYSMMVIERALPLWSENKNIKYKKAYTEGINETVDLMVKALTERYNYQTISDDKLVNFYDYTNQRLNKGKILSDKSLYRRQILSSKGDYHSIPTNEPKFSTLEKEVNKTQPGKARVVVYYPQGATSYQPHLLIDGLRYKTDLYVGGFFFFDIEPGEYTLTLDQDGDGTSLSNIVVGQIQNNIKPLTVDVDPNILNFIKFKHASGIFGHNFEFTQVDQSIALPEVSNLQYTGIPK